MKIIGLTQSKRVQNRYYIELEDGTSLRVNVALIADYDLFTGRELSAQELEALSQDAGRMNAKARALRIMGSRTMSRKELFSRLVQKGESEENTEDAVDWLESVGIINDEDYAVMIVRHYSEKGYGTARIKDELYKRGIPRELWEFALTEKQDGSDAIYALIDRKLKGAEPDQKELKKVTDMLRRRGFAWSEIRAALSEYKISCEYMDCEDID